MQLCNCLFSQLKMTKKKLSPRLAEILFTVTDKKTAYNIEDCSKPCLARGCFRLVLDKAKVNKLVHNLCTSTTLNTTFSFCIISLLFWSLFSRGATQYSLLYASVHKIFSHMQNLQFFIFAIHYQFIKIILCMCSPR